MEPYCNAYGWASKVPEGDQGVCCDMIPKHISCSTVIPIDMPLLWCKHERAALILLKNNNIVNFS